MSLLDESLEIKKAQQGDERAFEAILNFYQAKIYKYVLCRVHQAEDAADITQETFIKAFRHIDSFDSHRKFSSWLYAIASYALRDFWRHKRQRQARLDLAAPESLAEMAHDTGSSEQQMTNKIDINKAFKQMRDEHKYLLQMYHQHGLSYEEISKITKKPINTVKTHLHRGRARLREIIQA